MTGRAACLVGASLVLVTAGSSGASFHVAPDGKDANAGTKAEPFATLERARDAVRGLKQGGGLPALGVTVWVRGGTYLRSTSFELAKIDSGGARASVVYRNTPGEKPRLVGGVLVPSSKLRPVTDTRILGRLDAKARGKVVRIDLGALGVKGIDKAWPARFRGYAGWPELFFDGRPMTLSRWPNAGYARIAKVLDRGSRPRFGEKPDRPGRFLYKEDRPGRWTEAPEVLLAGYWCHKWYDECIRVARIDGEKKTITMAAPHQYGLGGASGGLYFAINLMEEIDAPGEYAFDRAAGALYFWPPGPASGVRRKELAVSVLGEPMVAMKDVSHVTLRGLTIEASRGSGVRIEGGEGNRVAGCTIRNLAGGGVTVRGGKGHGVISCDLYGLGLGGVSLSGGDRKTLARCDHHAINNHIHHYARLVRTYQSGIQVGGVGCRAEHNLIHDAPHMAMGFGGNDHLIQFNSMIRVCMDTDDAGAIYTGRDWTVRGTMIRHNFFHILGGGNRHGNRAVYLDDMACGTTVVGNVFSKSEYAVFIGGGRDNVTENNVIVNCRTSIRIDARGLGWAKYHLAKPKGTLITRLAEMPYRTEPWRSRYPKLVNILDDRPGWPKGNVVRRNLVYRSGAPKIDKRAVETGVVEANWSTKDDPGFADAKGLDFRLRRGSVAYRKIPGFEPVPFEKMGLRRDEYRTSLPRAGREGE